VKIKFEKISIDYEKLRQLDQEIAKEKRATAIRKRIKEKEKGE